MGSWFFLELVFKSMALDKEAHGVAFMHRVVFVHLIFIVGDLRDGAALFPALELVIEESVRCIYHYRFLCLLHLLNPDKLRVREMKGLGLLGAKTLAHSLALFFTDLWYILDKSIVFRLVGGFLGLSQSLLTALLD